MKSRLAVVTAVLLSAMLAAQIIRDEDGQLTWYVYIDLNTKDYGGFVRPASNL